MFILLSRLLLRPPLTLSAVPDTRQRRVMNLMRRPRPVAGRRFELASAETAFLPSKHRETLNACESRDLVVSHELGRAVFGIAAVL